MKNKQQQTTRQLIGRINATILEFFILLFMVLILSSLIYYLYLSLFVSPLAARLSIFDGATAWMMIGALLTILPMFISMAISEVIFNHKYDMDGYIFDYLFTMMNKVEKKWKEIKWYRLIKR